MDSDEERNWVYCGMIKLLGSFLKEKRGDICLYIGFIGVFYVIFSLSNLPVDAVNYAFFLSAIWLLGYEFSNLINIIRRVWQSLRQSSVWKR